MTMDSILERAKEVIANGCGCDRGCTELVGPDFYCGCLNDARTILDMAMDATESVVTPDNICLGHTWLKRKIRESLASNQR